MGEVLGGNITEGEGITSAAGIGDTLLVYIWPPRRDAMGISISRLPSHTHEQTGGEVLVIPAIFLAMEGDDDPGL